MEYNKEGIYCIMENPVIAGAFHVVVLHDNEENYKEASNDYCSSAGSPYSECLNWAKIYLDKSYYRVTAAMLKEQHEKRIQNIISLRNTFVHKPEWSFEIGSDIIKSS